MIVYFSATATPIQTVPINGNKKIQMKPDCLLLRANPTFQKNWPKSFLI